MLRDYAPLNFQLLQPGAGYAQPTQVVPDRVTLEDPAVNVMTDLKSVTAIIVLSGDPLDEAHRRMIQRAVRLLLVVDQNRRVVGVITASDILGEKPMQVIGHRGIRREELLVRDVMTPQEALEVIDLETVRTARVGHVLATLKRSGRQHAMVVEHDPKGRHVIRGIFSATQVARQLGIVMPPTSEIAHNFSQIEAQLAR
jgi:CBS-domain-containing membrane protein